MLRFRSIATLLVLAALAVSAYSQGTTGGLLYASDFANWSLPQGNTPMQGTVFYQSPGICTVASNGYTFLAPKVGRPLTIVDGANTETFTPTAVVANNNTCMISGTMAHSHSTYSIKSGTAGAQEAIDYQATQQQGAQIVLTPAWTTAGGNTGIVTATLKGNNGVTLLDQRTSQLSSYTWSGSAYVANPFAVMASGTVPGNCAQIETGNKITDTGAPCSTGVGNISGQVSGVIPLATGAAAIGAQSHLDDGVTTPGTVTITEPANVTTVLTAATAVAGTVNGTCAATAQHQADESLDIRACITAAAGKPIHIDAMGYTGTQAFSVNPFATVANGQSVVVDFGNYTLGWNPATTVVQLPSSTVVHLHHTLIQGTLYAQGASSNYGMFNAKSVGTTGTIAAGSNQVTVADASYAQINAPVAVMGAGGGTFSGNIPGTTLSASINNSQLEIPMTSITGWPVSGFAYFNDGANTEAISYAGAGSTCPITSASFCLTGATRGSNGTTANAFLSTTPVEYFTNNTNQQTKLTAPYTIGDGVLHVVYIDDGTGAGFATAGTLLIGQGPSAEMVSYSGVNSATCTSSCTFTGVTAINGTSDQNWTTGTTVQYVTYWTSIITGINGNVLTLADSAPFAVSGATTSIGSGNITLDGDSAVIDGGWSNFYPTGYSISAGGVATIQAVNNLPAGGGTSISIGNFTNGTYATSLNGVTATVVSATSTSFVVNLAGYALGASGSIVDAGTASPAVAQNANAVYILLVNNAQIGAGCLFQNFNTGAVETQASRNVHIYGQSLGDGHYVGNAPLGFDFLAFGQSRTIQMDIDSAYPVNVAMAVDDRTQHIDPWAGVSADIQGSIGTAVSGQPNGSITTGIVIQGASNSRFSATSITTNGGSAAILNSLQSTVNPLPVNNTIRVARAKGALTIDISAANGSNTMDIGAATAGLVKIAIGNHSAYGLKANRWKYSQEAVYAYAPCPTCTAIDLNFLSSSGNPWWDIKNTTTLGQLEFLDSQNANALRILLTPNSSSEFNSGGAGAVAVNQRVGSGTGGFEVGDGAGNAVAVIPSSGAAKFLNGITPTASTPVAAAGAVRMANTDVIAWENVAASGRDQLAINGSDQLTYNSVPVVTSIPPVAFSALTSGTNTSAAMLVGSGSTLDVTGTGTIAGCQTIRMSTPVTVTGVTGETAAVAFPFPFAPSANGNYSVRFRALGAAGNGGSDTANFIVRTGTTALSGAQVGSNQATGASKITDATVACGAYGTSNQMCRASMCNAASGASCAIGQTVTNVSATLSTSFSVYININPSATGDSNTVEWADATFCK